MDACEKEKRLQNCMPPKRWYWNVEQTLQSTVSKHFSSVWVPDLGEKMLKSASDAHSAGSNSNHRRLGSMQLLCDVSYHQLVSSTDTSTSCDSRLCSPNEDFGRPNKHFRTLFHGKHLSTFCIPSSTHALEKCFENFMLPKRRLWKTGPTFPNGFSKHFSTLRSPNRVLSPLKSASKIRISSFVPTSKIFVWGA